MDTLILFVLAVVGGVILGVLHHLNDAPNIQAFPHDDEEGEDE